MIIGISFQVFFRLVEFKFARTGKKLVRSQLNVELTNFTCKKAVAIFAGLQIYY